MKVLVVGAGVIGASIAEAVARRGADVTVMDMRSPGRGASQASAGVLAPYTEAAGKTVLFDLCARSLGMFETFLAAIADRSGRAIESARRGTVEVALSDAEAAHLKTAQAWLAREAIASDWIGAAELRMLEPSIATSAAGALVIPSQGFVNVGALVAALVQSARLAGAKFVSPAEAIEVMPSRDRVDVRAGADRQTFDHVVIAAGSWSRRVRVAGVPPLPVRPIRGQLLQLAWASGPIPSRVVWGPRCYTVPWPDGTLLVGATVEDVGFDEASTVDGVQTLTAAVAELLPDARHAALREVRVGLRPATPDGLPVIGPLRSAPNVTIATGHYRNGILLTPLTADMVCRYVLDRVADPMMKEITPDRFFPSLAQGARA
jgi:glycine oxidase